ARAARAEGLASRGSVRRALRSLRVPAPGRAPPAVPRRRPDARAPGGRGGPPARRTGDGLRRLGLVPRSPGGAPRAGLVAFRAAVLGGGGAAPRARAAVDGRGDRGG